MFLDFKYQIDCIDVMYILQGTGGSFQLGHGDSVKFTINEIAENVTFLEIRLKTVNVNYMEATPKDQYGNPISEAVCIYPSGLK